jgi:DNA gyrase subunit A
MERHWPATDVAPLIALIDDPRHKINEDGTFMLSDEQARAILALTLSRLTALGRDEIGEELNGLGTHIEDYLAILRSRERVMDIIRTELNEIKEQFSTPRLTAIEEAAGDFEDEDLIAREDMVVTVTHGGYIKRVPLSAYRAQRRGGKGRSGMATREEDFVSRLFVANTHTPVLFFSSAGQAYKLKVWRLPIAEPQGRGKALVNLLPLDQGERITSILPLPEDEAEWAKLDIMFSTRSGGIRRNSLADFTSINRNGKIAMKLDEGDEIVGVETAAEADDIMLTTALGRAIRFEITDVRVFKGRDSTGVRGIMLAEGDRVISMSILRHFDASPAERNAFLKLDGAARRAATGEEEGGADAPEPADEAEEEGGEVSLSVERYAQMGAAQQFVLTVNERGYGKISSAYDFRISNRGGKGIQATDLSKLDEIGNLIASFPVEMSDQIMLVSDGGQLIRVPVEGIRFAKRASKGVRIFKTAEDEKVVSVERISEPDGEENGNGEGTEDPAPDSA